MTKIEKRYKKKDKIKDIQRHLVKQARIKKKYLKTLREEGYIVPEKRDKSNTFNEEVKQENREKYNKKYELKQKKRLQLEQEETYRQNELLRIRKAEEEHLKKAQRYHRITQKTRSGQPLMGPKIEDLLNKIKSDDVYTN